MLVHKGAALVVPVLMVLLAITPSGEAVCSFTANGDVKVPTGLHTPPPGNHDLDGITISIRKDILTNKGFELRPTPGTAVSVINGEYLPDFDVAWYTSSDAYIDKAATDGPETGTSPSLAGYALIWLVHGPDLGNSDGKFPGAGWTLFMDC